MANAQHPQDDGGPIGTEVATVERANIAPMSAEARSAFALATPAEDPLLATVRVMAQLHELGAMMVKSGFCPRAVDTPEKAMAIMLTGREMGIGPMSAIRGINIVDGKPVIAADLQLGRFKASGGRSMFQQLDEKAAILHLRHPNGDEHVETWTHEQAQAAGLLSKGNWQKHKVAMMRSRVITAGLKSIGFECMAGVYDPDEADHWQPGASDAIARGDDPNALGGAARRDFGALPTAPAAAAPEAAEPATTDAAAQPENAPGSRYPSVWLKKDGREGQGLDAVTGAGDYTFTDLDLDAAGKFAYGKLKAGTAKNEDVLRRFCADCALELSRREQEKAERAADAGGA